MINKKKPYLEVVPVDGDPTLVQFIIVTLVNKIFCSKITKEDWMAIKHGTTPEDKAAYKTVVEYLRNAWQIAESYYPDFMGVRPPVDEG